MPTAGVRQLSKAAPLTCPASQRAAPAGLTGEELLWLMKECVVGLRGLEPRASSLSGTRSNRLSYNPNAMQLTCVNSSDQYPTAPARRVAPWFRTSGSSGPSRPAPRQRSACPRDGTPLSHARYSVSRRVTSTPPTSREVRLYTTEPIVDIAVISTMLSEPSRAV
jgi:hypothetical protein